MTYIQSESIDLQRLLEEVEKSDDLEFLDEIEEMLSTENQNLSQAFCSLIQQNTELKDGLNTTKCWTKELDQLHSDEVQKVENLRENIQVRHQEVLQEKFQQVSDLEQFESEALTISAMFASAPKEYVNNNLNEKINENNKILDEVNLSLQHQIEKVNEAKDKFEELIEMCSADLLEKIFQDSISQMTSSNRNIGKSIEKMSKEIDKLRFDMKTRNIAKH